MTTEIHDEIKASFDGESLEDLTGRIKQLFDVPARTSGFPSMTRTAGRGRSIITRSGR